MEEDFGIRKRTRTPPQISLWPLALLGILVALSWRLKPRSTDQNTSKSAHSNYSPEVKSELGKNNTLVTPQVAPSPVTHTVTYRCEHETPKWKQKLEYAAIFVALGLLIVNICQVRATRDAATAATSAATTAQKQLEMSDRPWMKDQVTAESALTFDDKGNANLTIIGSAKNIGHSVATGVTVNAQWIALPMNEYFTEPVKRETEFCDKIAKTKLDPMKWGTAVFPDDHTEARIGLSIARKDIEASRVPFEGHPGKNFGSFIVGCIDYQYPTSSKHHQTRFVYDVFCLNPKEPNHPSVVEIDRTWPAESLILVLHSFSGKYAY